MFKKSFFVFLFSSLSIIVFAQDKNYRVNGTIRTKDGSYKDAYIAVNGNKHYLDSLGNYDVALPFQEENILTYGRKGSVQQIIEFNTTAAKERIEDAFYPKEINIVLFDKVEGIDISLMKEPIERYAYSEDQYDFDNDEVYASEMKTKVETLITLIEQTKQSGTINGELAAKAKEDAEKQKLILEQAKKDALEKQRLEKEKQALELAAKKQEADKEAAEEAARRKTEREKRKKEDLEREQEAFRLAKEQDDAIEAEKLKQRQDAEAQLIAEAKMNATKDSILKIVKSKAIQEMEAKRLAEQKAKDELASANKVAKDEAFQESEEKRLAAEKAKNEEAERIRKEKEEQTKVAAQALKDKEAEEAKRKAAEMQALKDKLKNNNLDAESKRLEQLKAQEDLFKSRQSKFQPVMGIYSTTTSVIDGKKAFGYINFGNGIGNQDLTKEEFDAYKLKFEKK